MAETYAASDARQQLRQARAEFEQALRAGEGARAEQIFARYPALAADLDSALEIIYSTEFTLRKLRGEEPTPAEYYARFPQYRRELEELFRLRDLVGGGEEELGSPDHLDLPVEDGTDWGVEHFRVLEPLGQHGPVVVLKSRQLSRDRLVAIKMVAKDQTAPAELDRFRRGRDDQARLRHPNIVQVYDRGEDEDDLFFTMEFGAGGTLAQRIGSRPVPADEAARLLHALAGAVGYAHGQKILHRDLKPANVVLTADGTPKITDFGLAKRLEAESGPTRSGDLLGTPPYMAPEQIDGQAGVDARTEVYGLGAVLYEALTGRPPFSGKHEVDTLFQVRRCRVVLPRRHHRGVDRRLESICLKCLERRPRRRYHSARALADDLESWQHGRRPTAHGLPARLGRVVRRRPVAWAALLLALLVGTGAFVHSYLVNPARDLEDIKRRLARGEPVIAMDEAGPPVWSRWRTSDKRSTTEVGADRTFSVQCWDHLGLLELVDDPQQQRYRFRVEMRHDATWLEGRVGVYFAHQVLATSQGARRHYYGELTFGDAQKAKGTGMRAPLELSFGRCREGQSTEQSYRATLRSRVFERAQASPGAGPWCQLEVEVKPDTIRASWRRLGTQNNARLPVLRRDDLKVAAEHLVVDPRDEMPAFPARGGLGLFVYHGTASFRNAVIEPLLNGD
jgi:serine/threonine-protein kinase